MRKPSKGFRTQGACCPTLRAGQAIEEHAWLPAHLPMDEKEEAWAPRLQRGAKAAGPAVALFGTEQGEVMNGTAGEAATAKSTGR